MNKSNSPFVTGQAVLNDDFFDRENLLEEAYNFLNDNYKHVFLLFGQRRIGKTSFLLKLFNDAPQKLKVRTVFFDLQGYTDTPLPKLLYVIAQDSLQILGIDIQLNKDSFDDTDYFRRSFLPNLAQKLQTGEKLVFLFDEFDVIGAAEFIKDALPQDAASYKFIPFLATVFADIEQKQLPVKFVFAIGRNYKDLEENRYGSLLKNGVQHEIFMFDKSIVQQLAEQTSTSLPFTAQAVDKLFQLSGGHPLFAQCLADSAFRLARKNNDAKIAETLIDNVLESVIREKASAVRWIWETLPDNQKIILYLSALAAEKNLVFNITDIETEAIANKLAPYTEKIVPSLDQLIANRFLKKENGGYTFYVEVLRKWLIIENTIETISRLVTIFSDEQELLLKNAQFYFRKKDYKNAIDYYEKFLLQNYDSHEAFNNCATAYYETGDTDKAILYFRNAYRVSPILTNKILYMQLVEKQLDNKIINNLETFDLELELATIKNKSTDSIVIKQLEKELKTSFKQVPLAEIMEWKKYSSLYSLNEQGNVNGLHIKNFKFDTLPVSITELKQLSHLLIANAGLKDISPLKDLKQISSLRLSSNQISDISPLKDLKQISSLVLSSNQISDISPLKELKNIQELELKSNLISDISPLKELTNIQKLILTHNQIRDIATLKEFKCIHNLYLSYNKICDISPLKELKNIQKLGIGNNMIEDIAPLKELKNIQKLYLWRNKINDISPLKELPIIQILLLSDNQLSDLSPLIGLKKLSTLSLSKNPIKILPEWICDFPTMDIQWKEYDFDNGFIAFYDNPIENIPVEIIKQGKAAIKTWFGANKKKLNEIKVLLVGDAEAGKTSICKRLKDNTFDKHEKQTDGIKIEKLVFGELPTFSEQTRLHGLLAYMWDFGGQEIMTSTHRFFLTNRSVYILVLEARNDKSTETQIRKWLENITTQGGNSPVIIAVNKIDVNPAFDIDLYNLKKEFPQIAGYVRISCEKDENLHELKRLLETAIPQAELFNTEIDERWLKIKDELQEKTKANFKLNESEYLEICTRHELTKPKEQNQCVRFLHDLGIILHFDKMDLGEYYILDPLWVTTGVYRIITSEKAAKASGVVPYEELKELANTLKNETETGEYCKIAYSNNESRYLADIMEEFKLCFFASQKKLMLIPDLFKKETPAVEVEKIIHRAEKLEFIYDYPFLHHSVISRLIVAINGEIQTFWRSGVITTSKSLNATCLVRALNDQIQITVTGDKKDKRQYLSQIRYFVNQINEEFKLRPTLLIPLSENSFIEYEVLVEMEREGEKIHRDYKLKKNYQISHLLEGIASHEEIKRQSTSITNNYNTINVTGMNNKVIQDAVKSTIELTENK